jgi:hypothetical protein
MKRVKKPEHLGDTAKRQIPPSQKIPCKRKTLVASE